ncbi:MAG: gamma carbonic anhydrase family protein [Gammaproteobacteria bacterium]|jgi:carbonic anhydrase/acetyltransferase-like protein (isoleucine patch superfamily)
MTIRSYQDTTPALGNDVFVDDTALVVGKVIIGDDSSIWPMTVVRGDVNNITIGSRTNIQDGSVLHVTHPHETHPDGFALGVGNNVTVGHKVVLHGCVVEDNCLIGMGSIIMDGAVVRSHVLLGAGSLVSPGKELESGFLYLGSPVKKVRRLTEQEISWIDYSANHYVNLKNRYIG